VHFPPLAEGVPLMSEGTQAALVLFFAGFPKKTEHLNPLISRLPLRDFPKGEETED